VELVEEYGNGFYAAVGIHPHHVFDIYDRLLKANSTSPENMLADGENFFSQSQALIDEEVSAIESLINKEVVVAVGEIGLDKHFYNKTKYDFYEITEGFIDLQKKMLKMQLNLAKKYKKSVIFHNREARNELINTLNDVWDEFFTNRGVVHCCEPHDDLLAFAEEKDIYIGVDGDLTYDIEKQKFIKKIPLSKIVIETDAPFILPEPLKTEKKYPNEPANVVLVAEKLAEIKNISIDKVADITTQNGKMLFNVHEK
jgi:TatD DNase family protein